MELLYVTYQPGKAIKKDRKESAPPPLHTKIAQTNTKTLTHTTQCTKTQHNMGVGPQVPSLENRGGGLKSLLQLANSPHILRAQHHTTAHL